MRQPENVLEIKGKNHDDSITIFRELAAASVWHGFILGATRLQTEHGVVLVEIANMDGDWEEVGHHPLIRMIILHKNCDVYGAKTKLGLVCQVA